MVSCGIFITKIDIRSLFLMVKCFWTSETRGDVERGPSYIFIAYIDTLEAKHISPMEIVGG